MNCAVLIYEKLPNSPEMLAGINPNWPAKVMPDCDVPPDSDWVIMSIEELESYKAQYQTIVDLWQQEQEIIQKQLDELQRIQELQEKLNLI